MQWQLNSVSTNKRDDCFQDSSLATSTCVIVVLRVMIIPLLVLDLGLCALTDIKIVTQNIYDVKQFREKFGISQSQNNVHFTSRIQWNEKRNQNNISQTGEALFHHQLGISKHMSANDDSTYVKRMKENKSFRTVPNSMVTSAINWHGKTVETTDAIYTDAKLYTILPGQTKAKAMFRQHNSPTHNAIDQCLKGKRLKYYARNFKLFYTNNQTTDGANVSAECNIEIFSEPRYALIIHYLEKNCDPSNPLYIESISSERPPLIWTGCETLSVSHPWIPQIKMKDAHVRLRFSQGRRGLLYINMNITTYDTAHRTSNLETYLISETFGFIQTVSWNPEAKVDYDSYEKQTGIIHYPEGHIVMLSFRHLHLNPGHVLSIQHGEMVVERFNMPAPFVWTGKRYQSQINLLKNIPNENRIGLDIDFGFRLIFSFHKISEKPKQLENETWDCSVTNYFDFHPHLACNLMTQCARGEDEKDCGYQSCRSEGFLVQDTCYVIKNIRSLPERRGQFPMYYDAQDYCEKNGGTLAMLDTVKQWTLVTQLMKKYLMAPNLHIGLSTGHLKPMYNLIPVWENGVVAYDTPFQRSTNRPVCGFFGSSVDFVTFIPCYKQIEHLYSMCEFKLTNNSGTEISPNPIDLYPPANSSFSIDYVTCPQGHITHSFLACDVRAICFSNGDWSYTSPKESWDIPSTSSCLVRQLESLPPSFLCASVVQRVPYSMVCDHQQDCLDNSDEDFCLFLPCPLDMMKCGHSKQCYSAVEECNGIYDCLNGADDRQCSDSQLDPMFKSGLPVFPPPPPAVVTLNGKGMHQIRPLNTKSCPESHFQCSNGSYCLPVYVRCNSVQDCPRREDEEGCSRKNLCPGFYRCRSSPICLHYSHVCDGINQCPRFDDEMWCNITCPEKCQCWGLAFVCRQKFGSDLISDLRYVDARETGMTIPEFANQALLIYLGVARCQLIELGNVSLKNLHTLDLSYNSFRAFSIESFILFPQLKTLFLSGNPLDHMFKDLQGRQTDVPLHYLDLSHIKIHDLNLDDLAQFTHLQLLNVSTCGVHRIFKNNNNYLIKLRVLDLRGCPLHQFPKIVFKRSINLESVYADNFKICCETTLPDGFNLNECHAPFDEVSSCDALLRSDAYRVFLSVSAGMALIGNLASFGFRLVREVKDKSGFHVFVTHLCIADFLMGVYLSIIGVADRLYLGTYLWEDTKWRHSFTCTMAGFISLVSSEVSVFIICLITIDRFLALRFPLSRLRFRRGPAQLSSGIVWIMSCVLASIPLFSAFPFQEFYSYNGVCIPLPITRKEFHGDDYAFGIMIVLNFVVFTLIAVGQGMIYQTVRASTMAISNTNRQSTDMTIARRLIIIAVSDFLCWFPIGLLGLLATRGISIPSEFNIAIAIFVLPLNSVINPFLYTFNMIMEQRRKVKEARFLKWLECS